MREGFTLSSPLPETYPDIDSPTHSYSVVYDLDPVDYAADNAIVPTLSRVRRPSSAHLERRQHARVQAEAAQRQAHLLREQSAEADHRDALARAAAAVAVQVEARRRVRAMASAQAEVERWEAMAASMDEPSSSPQLHPVFPPRGVPSYHAVGSTAPTRARPPRSDEPPPGSARCPHWGHMGARDRDHPGSLRGHQRLRG
jgi:hypothetical protein